MDLEEAARTLKNIPLFSKLEPSKLKLLAFASDQLIFDDGEVIFSTGDRADSAYFIESGEAEVFVDFDDKHVKVNHLGPHDLFGEMALFLSTGRSAIVIAKGDLKVMKLDGSMFLKMVTENPDAALGVMTVLSEKLVSTSQSLANKS
ncbi:MAG: cyclic nucleotide-binding domain-containing protein [Rhodospirillales bacterium]|nr:cyclic nucleotide-binding domain-containing protein [Rhodospirillales bacterium]